MMTEGNPTAQPGDADPGDEPTAPVPTVDAAPQYSPQFPGSPQFPDSAQYSPQFPDSAQYSPQFPDSPQFPAAPAPKRKRRVGLIVGIVLTVVLLLCAGGSVAAYLLIQNAEPVGAKTPEQVTIGFLEAVYTDHDVAAVEASVCPAARDKAKLTKIIDDLAAFEQKYDTPLVTWDTPVIEARETSGTARVSLHLKTANEQVADKKLVLELLNSRGWWVCDVKAES